MNIKMEEVLPQHWITKVHFSGNKVEHIKELLSKCYSIVFDYTFHKHFYEEMKKTRIVRIPKKRKKTYGTNTGIIIGFDDEKKCFLIKTNYDDNEYFYMEYDFIDSENTRGFWSIYRSTSGG